MFDSPIVTHPPKIIQIQPGGQKQLCQGMSGRRGGGSLASRRGTAGISQAAGSVSLGLLVPQLLLYLLLLSYAAWQGCKVHKNNAGLPKNKRNRFLLLQHLLLALVCVLRIGG